VNPLKFTDNLLELATNYEETYKRQVIVHKHESPEIVYRLEGNIFKQIGNNFSTYVFILQFVSLLRLFDNTYG